MQQAGRRLVAGHRIQTGRLRHWITERHEPKSTACRAAVLAAVAYILWQTVDRTPEVMWPLAIGWTIAAWRAAKPTPEQLRRQLLEGILALMGDQPGIFLADLYPALRSRPWAAHLDDTRLRAVLEQAGLDPRKQIRIGKQSGNYGIRRKDVEALLSPTPVEAPSEDVEAGQSPTEGAVEAA
jgi:hypothetical protein